MATYTEMGEGAVLNYLAGLVESGAMDALRAFAAEVVAGTVAGALAVGSTTDASSTTTGSFKTAGGAGIAKKLFVGDALSVAGNVTVSKATPIVKADATSGNACLAANSAAGALRGMWITTGGSTRWIVVGDSTAESGSNVGTDFIFTSYADNGSTVIGVPLRLWRSTGKATLGMVGATAGLEFGTSGPRDMVGSGSPEGVVSAPVNSTWRQTDSTVGVLKWTKTSGGSGNTGWKAGVDSDTGLRNLAAEPLSNGWAVSAATFTLRRVGQLVFMTIVANKAAASPVDSVIYTLPAGFRPDAYVYPTFNSGSADDYCTGYVATSGAVLVYGSTMTGPVARITVSFFTSDPWPAALPGA